MIAYLGRGPGSLLVLPIGQMWIRRSYVSPYYFANLLSISCTQYLEFLSLLIEQLPTTKLLLVLTFRPEFMRSKTRRFARRWRIRG